MIITTGLSLIILLPLINTCLAGFFGAKLGASTVGKLSVTLLGFAAGLSIFAFVMQSYSSYIIQIVFGKWFSVLAFELNWTLYFDSASCTMCVVITFISFLVHFYSLGYLAADPGLTRFLSYLSLFTFFMLLFVLSINLVQMFIGWEGVGLVSYLLINFWYDRKYANQAALKAIIMNRVGDFFFLLAILFAWSFFGTVDLLNFNALNQMELLSITIWYGISIHKLTLIGICLLLASLVKSAQFGFHTWLADAMEGPTPVSALLHAATMVTAGVFLVIRSSSIFIHLPGVNTYMLIIATITTFFASFIAFFQYDIKKIIAYSTCAQLGLMFVACALNQYTLALFHLFNHAFFKALLFLCAGIMIHGAHDEQDIRKFGNFRESFPITYKGFLIASLSLMGIPGLTGYYSKDPIFETLLLSTNNYSFTALWLTSLGTFFTAAYSIRVLIIVFYNKQSGFLTDASTIHETNEKYLIIPIILLTVLSISIGYVTLSQYLLPETSIFKISQISHYINTDLILTEMLSWKLKLLPLIVTLAGSTFAIFHVYSNYYLDYITASITILKQSYYKYNIEQLSLYNFITIIQRTFNFDNVYYNINVKLNSLFAYKVIYKNSEKGILEYVGPTGISHITLFLGSLISKYNKVTISQMLFSFFLFLLIALFLISTVTIDNTTNQLMLFLFTVNKRVTPHLIKEKFYFVKIRWMPKGSASAPIIKAIDPQKVLYIPKKNFMGFRQTINIKNKVLDNTTEHTMYVEAQPSNNQIQKMVNQTVSVRHSPFSNQYLDKQLVNSQHVTTNLPPSGMKTTMLVNPFEVEVPISIYQSYIATLKNLPINSNPKPGVSVTAIRADIQNGIIDPNTFQEKRVLNVHKIEDLVNKYPASQDPIKTLISIRFLKSTCPVLETQVFHLIQSNDNHSEVKEVTSDIEDTLKKELVKTNMYTTKEIADITKCHNGICVFKSTIK